jgi:hypothetical protein
MPIIDPVKRAAKALYLKEYRNKNKEAIALYQKEYRDNNKEVLTEKQKKYRDNNKEAIAEYRQVNREAIAKQKKEYRQVNKEALAEYQKEWYQKQKQNISYIITVCSDFYFGHSAQGLEVRRQQHIAHFRAGTGNVGLQKHFDELGEEAFIKAFGMQILGTFETTEEAKAEETYLLSQYIGTPGCLNVRLT